MSSQITPTEEQEAVLDYYPKGRSFKISAFAGSGKTSTLKLLGNSNSKKKCAYLAFNKNIATEARSKFSSNVKCQTFHALAYKSVPKFIQDKLNQSRYMPNDIARDFKLFGGELHLKTQPNKCGHIGEWEQSMILSRAVDNFCRSTDKQLKLTHVLDALPKWALREKSFDFASQLVESAQIFWEMCISEKYSFKINPDIYLKYWSLQKPSIAADCIFFDEAQDADPIMLNILKSQSIPVILVGDKHQSIYRWRGAINAMQSVQIPEFYLTKSFRFGQAVADNANIILNNLLGERKKIIGNENIDSKICLIEQPTVYLARTNATAFEIALICLANGLRPKIAVDSDQIIAMLNDCEKLIQGEKLDTRSVFYGFRSWQEVQIYVDIYDKAEFAPFVRLVQKNELRVLRHIVTKMSNPVEHDCIIMTAHKSKGLEFDKVKLLGDFPYSLKPDDEFITDDEARLLYVAGTRAINELDISDMDEFYNIVKVTRYSPK